MHRVTGALATAPAPAPRTVQPAALKRPLPPRQGLLFPDRSKVVAFEAFSPGRVEAVPRPKRPAASPPGSKVQRRRPLPASDLQPSLDFLPPAPPAPRTLKTSVEAVIYCDMAAASAMHRSVAAALDLSMVLIAFGAFLLTFHFGGGDFTLDRLNLLIFGGAFGLILAFYGLIWVLTRSETPGMRWTHLRLINFDGFPPDATHRALRWAGTCLSICAAGLGILWALVDEESLTWQDHISKTFPTFRENETNFVRRSS